MKNRKRDAWIQVHENDWKGDDIYIGDLFHHSGCWGDCYRKEDFLYLAKINLKTRTRRDTKYFYKWWTNKEIARLNLRSDPLTYKQVKERLRQKNRIYIIIELAEKKIGYVTARFTEENDLDIGMMIYDYKYRNKGLAQKILNIVMPFLNKYENNVKACTRSENAKHLLKKLGFIEKNKDNFFLKK